MKAETKKVRYERFYNQIFDLVKDVKDPNARMATICAVLHHKMDYYFWTGFYCLKKGELIVDVYQGPLACLRLKKDKGVCWAGINQKKTIVVSDVEQFSEHIACSSLSKSEIVVPLKDAKGSIIGVLDVDSRELNSFDEVDVVGLEKIVDLVYS